MPTLGEKLRAARVAKGVSPQQAELEIRFRAVLIQYLEEDFLAKLPPPPFTRGLLRIYALYLGLDPDEIVDEYDVLNGLRKPDPVVSIPPPSAPPPTALFPLEQGPPVEVPEPFTGMRFPALPDSEPESTFAPLGTFAPARVVPHGNALVPPSSFEMPPESALDAAAPAIPELAPVPGQVSGAARRTFPVPAEVLAIGIILLVIVLLSYTALSRFAGSGTNASGGAPLAAARASGSPTVTPTATAEGPTPIRTFIVTPGGAQPNNSAAGLNAPPTAISLPPGTMGMTLTVVVQGPMSLWVVADNREVFKGDLTSGTQTWVAGARLYVQVRNIPNGTVTLSGRPVQAATFAERSLLERAWIINPRGTPMPVVPDASFRTPGPTPTKTNTPRPAPTRTPLPSRTPPVSPTVTPMG